MPRFRFRASVAVSILALGAAAAGGVVAATQSSDEQALQPTRQAADRGVESRVNDLLAKMTLEEKLEQIQLLPDFMVTEDEVRKGLGSVLSVTDPVEDQGAAAHRRRGVAAEDPDPVRLRHDPRLPDDLPDPAGRRRELRSAGGVRRPHVRRARVGRRRAQADLRADGRRLARAALGPHRRGRRRGSLPELGARGRARQGDPGHRLQRARQARRQPQALRGLRPARERP